MRSIVGIILTILCILGLVVPVALGATTGAPDSVASSDASAPASATTAAAVGPGSTAPAGIEAPDTGALTATSSPTAGYPVTPEADSGDLLAATITFLLRGEIQFAFAAFLMLGLQQLRRFWDAVPDEWRGPAAAGSLGAFATVTAIFGGVVFGEALVHGARIGLMAMGSFSVLRPVLARIPKVGAWLGFKRKKKALVPLVPPASS